MFKCRMKSLASNGKMCVSPKRTLEEFRAKKGGLLSKVAGVAKAGVSFFIGKVQAAFKTLGLDKIFNYLQKLAKGFFKTLTSVVKKALAAAGKMLQKGLEAVFKLFAPSGPKELEENLKDMELGESSSKLMPDRIAGVPMWAIKKELGNTFRLLESCVNPLRIEQEHKCSGCDLASSSGANTHKLEKPGSWAEQPTPCKANGDGCGGCPICKNGGGTGKMWMWSEAIDTTQPPTSWLVSVPDASHCGMGGDFDQCPIWTPDEKSLWGSGKKTFQGKDVYVDDIYCAARLGDWNNMAHRWEKPPSGHAPVFNRHTGAYDISACERPIDKVRFGRPHCKLQDATASALTNAIKVKMSKEDMNSTARFMRCVPFVGYGQFRGPKRWVDRRYLGRTCTTKQELANQSQPHLFVEHTKNYKDIISDTMWSSNRDADAVTMANAKWQLAVRPYLVRAPLCMTVS